jgi:ribosome-associated protein
MTDINKDYKTEKLVEAIVEGMQDKKANNIVTLDLRKLENAVTKFFVICDAESTTQINAIADAVEEFARKKTKEKPYSREGFSNADWILIDYVDVVVHVFQKSIRDFYKIEELWADCEQTAY